MELLESLIQNKFPLNSQQKFTFQIVFKTPSGSFKSRESVFFFIYKIVQGQVRCFDHNCASCTACSHLLGFFFFFFIAGLRGSEAFPLPTSICFSNLSSHGDLVMPGVLL